MANTRIQLHSSGTSTNQPSLGVLANGEIAINFADGIIYYKTDANALGEIKTTTPSGLDTEIQFNDGGDFGANSGLTFTKGTGTLAVGTSLTVNSVDIPGRLDSAYGHANAAFTAANNAGGEVVDDTTPQLGGNLDVNGNDIVSTSNADIDIIPNGTGDVVLSADTVKVGDSGAAATLTSNGAGALTVTTGGAADLVLSTNSGTDSGTITITDGADGNINLAPNGSGQVQAGGAQLSTVGKSIAMALVFG